MRLYRGVNMEMYENLKGELIPKEQLEFKKFPTWESPWGGTWHLSEDNAVLQHQQDQKGNPTSGVSTTPHFERAKFYATCQGTKNGYIYEIDTELFSQYKVAKYVVAKYTDNPSIPEDEEIILVSHNFSVLPKEIIKYVHKIII